MWNLIYLVVVVTEKTKGLVLTPGDNALACVTTYHRASLGSKGA